MKLWTDDGRTPEHGHPISSPCEPSAQVCLKLVLIGQEVSEKKLFECYCNIHVYCPEVGADQPLGSNFFSESYIFSPFAHFLQVFFLSNDILTIFPIQMHGQPMLTLP